MNIALIAFVVLMPIAGLFWAYRAGVNKGDERAANKRMREYAEESQGWANMPLTDDEFVNELRERIERKNKAKD